MLLATSASQFHASAATDRHRMNLRMVRAAESAAVLYNGRAVLGG